MKLIGSIQNDFFITKQILDTNGDGAIDLHDFE
jgi:hypothetical protein